MEKGNIYCNKYRGSWCLGDARSHGISSNAIDPFLTEFCGLIARNTINVSPHRKVTHSIGYLFYFIYILSIYLLLLLSLSLLLLLLLLLLLPLLLLLLLPLLLLPLLLLSLLLGGTMSSTSNGSWCIGIKGEMSGTVCVTFTWNIYIYTSCL